MLRKIIYFLIGIAIVFLYSCTEQSRSQFNSEDEVYTVEKEFVWNMKNELPYILISDTSLSGLEFTFKINDKFWFCRDSMISYIRKMPVAKTYGTNLEIVQAWEFVSSYTFHHRPLDQNNKFIHSPSILLNSAGYGLCDDRAAVLCKIWEEMGYLTRIYHVDGYHVFPEVFDGNKWMMFDPDYNLVLLTGDDKVASVAEIVSEEGLKPFRNVRTTAFYNLTQNFVFDYPKYLQKIYESADTSDLNSWFTDAVNWSDFRFKLPSGSSLEFPIFTDSLISPLCKITIPGYYNGLIEVPLVINSINNATSRSIANCNSNGKGVGVGAGLIWIAGKDAVIYAYINPILLETEKRVKFTYYSYKEKMPQISITALNVNLNSLPLIVEKFSKNIISKRDLIRRVVTDYMETGSLNIVNSSDLLDLTVELLACNNADFDVEVIVRNIKLIDTLMSKNGIPANDFYGKINDPDVLATTLLIIEKLNEEELDRVLRFYFVK